MDQQKLTKIFSIVIGFIISIILIFMSFRFIQNTLIRAEDYTPRDVVVSDVSQNSVKISWATGRESQGVVEYGTTPTALNFFAPETQKSINHSVDLTLLSPNTTYYFQIRIGDKKYDNGGVPWSFTTKGQEIEQQTIPRLSPMISPTITSPNSTPTIITNSPSVNICHNQDCQKIKEMIGKGCTAKDYSQCLLKNISPSPTLRVAPKITISPTRPTTPTTPTTPTITPTNTPSPTPSITPTTTPPPSPTPN